MASSSATRRLALCVGASLSTAFGGHLAYASPSAAEAALAQQDFNDARALFDTGHIREACDKFAMSQQLDPRGGTLLNLAICHEKEGKTASAWLEYSNALAMARNEGRADREGFATQHIERLAPQLSHVRLNVPPDARVAGFAIKLDGAPIQDVAWGTDLAVDPGTHTVEASAKDHASWQRVIRVGESADRQVVDVPALVAIASPPAAPQPVLHVATEESSGTNARRTVGFVVGGVGLASTAVGAVFGFMAIGERHDAESLCKTNGCGSAAQSANSDGLRDAWVSDFTLGAGVLGLAVGTYLALTGKPVGAQARGGATPATLSVTGRGFSVGFALP